MFCPTMAREGQTQSVYLRPDNRSKNKYNIKERCADREYALLNDLTHSCTGLTKFPTSARKRTPTAGPPRSLPLFELVTSEVFEAKDPHRKEVFYCAYCGPILVRRRRSDGCFLATLVRTAYCSRMGISDQSPSVMPSCWISSNW